MNTMTIEDNKALVRRFAEEVFNRRNLAAIDEILAPNQVDHTLPPTLPPNTEGSKQAISTYLDAFPDLHVTIDDMVAEGDKVAMRFTSRGTQRRPFGGIPPTGREMTISSYLIARVADGKIVEQWGVDDQLGMLRQLGVIPAMFGFVFLVGLGVGMGLTVLLRKIFT
ncbi:MAG TPA: ester cyclase [Ktedonobacterales bacterium]|nr:ester cyclase [Ktedonobacterales bacterium]